MKKFILSTALVLIASPSFAMHAYIDVNCKATLANGKTLDMGSASGSHEFQVLKDGQQDNDDHTGESKTPVVINGSSLDMNTPYSRASLFLKVSKETKVSETSKMTDKCWEQTVTKVTSKASVQAVAFELQTKLGLKDGQKLNLSCEQTVDAPAGQCD